MVQMLVALSASALIIATAHALVAGPLHMSFAGTYADAYNTSNSLAASCSCIGMGG